MQINVAERQAGRDTKTEACCNWLRRTRGEAVLRTACAIHVMDFISKIEYRGSVALTLTLPDPEYPEPNLSAISIHHSIFLCFTVFRISRVDYNNRFLSGSFLLYLGGGERRHTGLPLLLPSVQQKQALNQSDPENGGKRRRTWVKVLNFINQQRTNRFMANAMRNMTSTYDNEHRNSQSSAGRNPRVEKAARKTSRLEARLLPLHTDTHTWRGGRRPAQTWSRRRRSCTSSPRRTWARGSGPRRRRRPPRHRPGWRWP